MANFIVIVVCLVLGFVVRRAGGFARAQVRPLNFVILWMSLPALVLAELPEIFARGVLSRDVLALASMPWLVFTFTLLVALAIGRALKWSRGTTGAVALTAGLGNTSFVGFPLIEMFYGKDAVSLAIVVDQPGTFLALSTAGIAVASVFSAKGVSIPHALKRMFTFPPLLAVVASASWAAFGLPREGALPTAFERLGTTLVPLALVSVGWQIDLDLARWRARSREIAIGLGLKLVLSPLLVYLVYSALLDRASLVFQVVVLEAAMAPMITAAVVAGEMDLDGELAQLLLGLGIPLSFVTVTGWWWWLG